MPLRALLIALSVALAMASVRDAAAATPDEDFAEAKVSFRNGNFSQAISLLTGLLYPKPLLAGDRERLDAHVLLAASYFEAGNKDAAKKQFEEALELDFSLNSEFTITVAPPLFSVETSKFFEKEKVELKERYAKQDEFDAKAAEAARLRFILDNMLVSERRLFYANFIPFGVGQFQNGHRGKGIFFLTAQIATIGASTGLFTYQLLRYPDGKVPRDDVDQVKTIQVLQVSTGAVAIGLIVAGILDAWYHYEPTVLRKPDKQLLEQWEKLREDLPGRKKKTSALDSLKLIPTVTSTGVGATVFLEF